MRVIKGNCDDRCGGSKETKQQRGDLRGPEHLKAAFSDAVFREGVRGLRPSTDRVYAPGTFLYFQGCETETRLGSMFQAPPSGMQLPRL